MFLFVTHINNETSVFPGFSSSLIVKEPYYTWYSSQYVDTGFHVSPVHFSCINRGDSFRVTAPVTLSASDFVSAHRRWQETC